MYALLGKSHELWTFRPVFFIPVIVTTLPHSIIFHYHLIFIFLYFHHYLFHSSFSLLGHISFWAFLSELRDEFRGRLTFLRLDIHID